MILGEPILLGGKGETASIFVTGLTENDTVTATKDGKTWNGVWVDRPILPSGYTEVEYIQGDGNAYINTGHKVTQNDVFTFSYKILTGSYDDTHSFWGGGDGYGTNQRYHLCYGYINLGGSWQSFTQPQNTVTNCEISMGATSQSFSIDGAVIKSASLTLLNGSYDVYLFRSNQQDSLYGNGLPIQYGEYIVTNGTSIVQYFKPCKNASNEYGFYDLVSETFFGNANNTGSFTGGNEVHHYGHLISKLNSYGTYTVTATNQEQTKTATESVLVDMATEYEIEMDYKLWLYKDGDMPYGYSSIVNDNSVYRYGVLSASTFDMYCANTTSITYFVKLIFNSFDVTDYSKAKAIFKVNTNYSKILVISGTSEAGISNASIGEYEVELDISSITGSQELLAFMNNANGTSFASGTTPIQLKQFWLE